MTERLCPERIIIYKYFKSIYEYDNNGEILARDLERGCYAAAVNACIESGGTTVATFSSVAFTNRYSEIVYRAIYAIHPYKSSIVLHDAVLTGEVAAIAVGGMSAAELDPHANADIRSIIDVRSQVKIEKKVSRMYICKKCGKNETNTIEHQTAAADEGSTLSIQCINPGCGNIWRIR